MTRVRVLRLNDGADADAALIEEATGVWCPPEVETEVVPSASN